MTIQVDEEDGRGGEGQRDAHDQPGQEGKDLRDVAGEGVQHQVCLLPVHHDVPWDTGRHSRLVFIRDGILRVKDDEDLVSGDNPHLLGDGLGRDGVVPRDHDHLDPCTPALGDSIRNRSLRWVNHAHQANKPQPQRKVWFLVICRGRSH